MGNVVPSEPSGRRSQTTIPSRPHAACVARRRGGEVGVGGGAGPAVGGASPTVPAAVRTLSSLGSRFLYLLCLLVPGPGPARGPEASER